MEPRVLAIGDPTLDTYLSIHQAHLALALDRDRGLLCIDYADKIPVDAYLQTAGGNAANVARAMARLGMPTALYGVIGGDPGGETVVRSLVDAGVDVRWLAVDPARSTNASTALLFQGERTLFVWHQPRSYQLPRAALPPCVYLTSVGPPGPAVERLHQDVCEAVGASRVQLVFSPGTHQLRMGRRALAPLLERCDTLVLNREEGGELAGMPADDMPALLAALHDLGPRTVVVTDGSRGSWALAGGQVARCGTTPVAVVDRTGAGDAYSSAFTCARLLGRPVAEAMLWGTIEAESVVGRVGASAGLLTREQLLAELRRRSDQDESARHVAAAKPVQRVAGLAAGHRLDVGSDGDLRRDAEEL